MRLRRIWPAVFIILVWFVFSSPFFLKGRIPFPSTYLVSFFPPWNASYGMPVKNNAMPDVITQIYPWKKLTVDSWRMGQIPLWNPYSFAGTPHAANYQTAVFSPFNALFFLFRETTAWSLLILLQPLLAGIFMYKFLRAIERTQAASTLGSVAFMFCGFMVVWMAYSTLGYAALFLPFIFWCIRRNKGIVISLGIALSLVSGHFQISVYVIGAAVFYILWKRQWRTLWFVFLGLLIAVPQLILAFDAYRESVRSALFIKGEIIPWQYLITFLSPDYYGNPVTRNDWFGHYAEWAGYIGVFPLLFALFSFFRKKSSDQWFFVLLGILTLGFALPTPLSDLLFRLRIPVLSTSAASRIIILTSFSFCVLGAFGLDLLRRDWQEKKKKPFLLFAGFIVIILLAIMYFAYFLPADKLLIAKRNSILPVGLAICWIVLASIGFFQKKRWIFVSFMVLIAAADMFRFAAKWMPFDPKEYMYPKTDMVTFLQKQTNYDRVFGNFGGEMSTYFGLHSIEGYDAVYQKRYGEFIEAADNGQIKTPERSVVLLGKKAQYAQRVLDLLGVKYLVHRFSDGRNVWAYPYWDFPQYRSVYKDDMYEVLENTGANPRFYLASHYVKKIADQEIISSLFDPVFDMRNTVVLETDPVITPETGEGTVEVVLYTPNEIIFQTVSDVSKLLMVSDTYDSRWKASVDGKQTPLYRANYDFRVVGVPKGTHIVRMNYQL